MPKDWHSPQEIVFTEEQIVWLLSPQNWDMIQSGEWPPEGKETGYVGKSSSRNHKGPFETAIQVSAELKVRLEYAGNYGVVLMELHHEGLNEWEIATRHNILVSSVERYKNWGYHLVTGRDRRWMK